MCDSLYNAGRADTLPCNTFRNRSILRVACGRTSDCGNPNQCTILSNQLSAYGYLSDPTSEVIDSNLTQLTNIYNGRVMIMDEDLCVIKDTYNLDEGKTNVSESVVRCMRTKPTNHYDKKNHYIEVTSPINIPGEKEDRRCDFSKCLYRQY